MQTQSYRTGLRMPSRFRDSRHPSRLYSHEGGGTFASRPDRWGRTQTEVAGQPDCGLGATTSRAVVRAFRLSANSTNALAECDNNMPQLTHEFW